MRKIAKSTLVVALIAAAAFGGVKTYGAYSATDDTNLLAENVEALSDGGETKASCTASVDCTLGDKKIGSVSCTGYDSCKAYLTCVECDGVSASC